MKVVSRTLCYTIRKGYLEWGDQKSPVCLNVEAENQKEAVVKQLGAAVSRPCCKALHGE